MFGFMRNLGAHSPSAPIRRAIEADGLPMGVDRLSALAVVEQRGRYDGRAVTHIRIFEPAWARALGIDVRAFGDLDAHPSLVLKSGHIERSGTVVITARAPESEVEVSSPTTNDRAHGEDDPSFALAPDSD